MKTTAAPGAQGAPGGRVVDELVINWHVTEACNFRCQYCYSTWQREDRQLDVVRDEAASIALLQALWDFFRPDNAANPLRQALRWSHVRLSIAGGEALLYPRQVLAIARRANELGMRVSLITNGALLPEGDALAELARHLSILGLSLDSFSAERNLAIGRADRQGRTLTLQAASQQLEQARTANPDLVVKVNTVVNAANVDEDLLPALALLQPERWKVLRMLPVVNSALAVSDVAFARFVNRHGAIGTRMSVEDNADMLGSYVMIDPQGRFFQNGTGRQGSYFYSRPVTAHNVHQAFASIPFSAERFAARYPKAKAA
jgi:radical S-adenosyl methionine domain-containing protein 2